MPSPSTKRRVLVQAGHNKPLQPGHETQTGAAGEAELAARIQKRLVDMLRRDGRFEPLPMPGLIPKGTKADAAVFLHGDGAAVLTASGFSFGFPDAAVNRKLADLIASEFARIPGHPHRRPDNGTDDAHMYYGFGLVASDGPETLIEHGFLSNPTERQWLQSHVPQLARAEYAAICRFFGLTPAEAAGTPSGETLTTNSTILAAPRASAAQMRQHLIARHHAHHSSESHYKDRALAHIISLYVKTSKSVGIDPLVAVSQMELETAHLTSNPSQPPRRNPAGIGITGSSEGVSFPTWDKAVRAHVGRLAAYAIPKEKGTQAQKALIAEALRVRELDDSKRGSAVRLKGLSHNWADDTKYADKIAQIGTQINA